MPNSQLSERSVLKAINRFALELLSISTPSDLFWYAAKDVVGEMGFADCIIYQADHDGSKLFQVSAFGVKNPKGREITRALEIPFGHGITGCVAESGTPCIVGDLSKDSRYTPDAEPALSEVCVPFFTQGVLAGVIDCEDPEKDAFDNFHMEILTTVGAMISAKLDSLVEIDEISRQTQALKPSKERFALAVRGPTDGIWDRDMKTQEAYYSPRLSQMLGYAEHELLPTHRAFLNLLHHDDIATLKANEQQTIDAGGKHIECEFRMLHKNGTWLNILSRGELIWEGGVPVRMVGTHLDITSRKQSEESLRRTEEMLFEGIEALPVGFAFYDASDKLVLFNKNYQSLLPKSAHLIKQGARLEELTRNSVSFVASVSGYDDVEAYAQERLTSAREPGRLWTYKLLTGRWLTMTEHPTSGGGFISIIEDITDDRERQSQLHQAQKMEAIGQLTGGIAHDFNNLLAVILGNAEMLEDAGEQQSPMTSSIIRASERGAELTHRLLAFSRQQPLNPEVVNLCKMTTGMLDLFQRTLGETIKISTRTQNDLWGALADPGQVENALLNFTINARDAMPDGGELTIECANITLEENNSAKGSSISAGDFVVLSVTDNGKGMSEEVQKHVFEPFFTTKEVGMGSGLGLSMVYGFAQQSGGQVTIYSEEGKGTTAKLYLPRVRSEVDSQTPTLPEAVPRGLGETILLVEDDPDVRNLAEMMLKNLGYKVVCAEDVQAARIALDGHSEINLILSDVVLPGGSSGPEFAEELCTSRPELKVIFMSGYPAEAAKRNGFLGSDSVLLNKPFRIAQLAKAVKEALG